MTTSAQRDEYRLTESDETAIRARMRVTVQHWQLTPASAPKRDDEVEELMRVGVRAIGCSLYDLRESELQWLRNEAGAISLNI